MSDKDSMNSNGKKKYKYAKKDKKSKLDILYKLYVFFALIVIIILLLLRWCSYNPKENTNKKYYSTDVSDTVTDEQETSDSSPSLEGSYITMSMNTSPVFKSSSAKGNLRIKNDTKNKNPLVVEIYRDDTKELIYTSSMIPVGKYVNEDTLDVQLPKGEYKCTAYFISVDENTGESLGKGGVNINITIQN